MPLCLGYCPRNLTLDVLWKMDGWMVANALKHALMLVIDHGVFDDGKLVMFCCNLPATQRSVFSSLHVAHES